MDSSTLEIVPLRRIGTSPRFFAHEGIDFVACREAGGGGPGRMIESNPHVETTWATGSINLSEQFGDKLL